jgi:hypothetical protein
MHSFVDMYNMFLSKIFGLGNVKLFTSRYQLLNSCVVHFMYADCLMELFLVTLPLSKSKANKNKVLI